MKEHQNKMAYTEPETLCVEAMPSFLAGSSDSLVACPPRFGVEIDRGEIKGYTVNFDDATIGGDN